MLLGFSALLTILGAWLKIMSYGGANETLLVGIITFPVAMVWMIYASRQEQENNRDEGLHLSSAEWYLLGLAEQQPEDLSVEQVKKISTPHFTPDRLVEAYVLLKNKGLITGGEEEDTLELMRILQQQR